MLAPFLFVSNGSGWIISSKILLLVCLHRLTQRTEIHHPQTRKVVNPIETAKAESPEDHPINRHQICTLRNPNRPHVEVHVIVPVLVLFTIDPFSDESARSPE